MITKLIRPVFEPHKITSPYGERIIWGKKQFHDGIDYVNKNNDQRVRAIADGVIVLDVDYYIHKLRWSDNRHSAGNFVILKHSIHGKDYFVRYMHLKENYVSKSDKVKQGTVLGEYANVGKSTGPHVHIDMYNQSWVKLDLTPILIKGLTI